MEKRYYIANLDNIPYRSQPDKGYTKLQVIQAVWRYAKEDAKLYGGNYTDYIYDYHILDIKTFKQAHELYTAL